MRRLLIGGVLVALAAGMVQVPAPSETEAAATYSKRLRAAASDLPLRVEPLAGYARDKFRHWLDGPDRDRCDTREEVLIQEARRGPRLGPGCRVVSGRWFSYYDRRYWNQPSDVDIDHVVALAEAWDSGAKRWTAGTRERFANDLGDRRTLVAVTDNVNQSKSDRDPSQWMPRYAKCRYAKEWIAVKLRWRLSVNGPEKRFLQWRVNHCPNTVLTLRRAAVAYATPGGSGGGGRVRFGQVVYDPVGTDDGSNLNAERVVLVNRGARAQGMGGWTLRDSAGHSYRFPAFTLRAGEKVTVHSGNGRNRAHHLYAGWGYTWNNTGDRASLRNRGGTLVDRCSWGDGDGSTGC